MATSDYILLHFISIKNLTSITKKNPQKMTEKKNSQMERTKYGLMCTLLCLFKYLFLELNDI